MTTCNCDNGEHHRCDGYCAPLVYSDTEPCECVCHEGILGRDFQRGLARAQKSYYGTVLKGAKP